NRFTDVNLTAPLFARPLVHEYPAQLVDSDQCQPASQAYDDDNAPVGSAERAHFVKRFDTAHELITRLRVGNDNIEQQQCSTVRDVPEVNGPFRFADAHGNYKKAHY